MGKVPAALAIVASCLTVNQLRAFPQAAKLVLYVFLNNGERNVDMIFSTVSSSRLRQKKY